MSDEKVQDILIEMVYIALRHRTYMAYLETSELFYPIYEFEEVLKKFYSENETNLPRVNLFHGEADAQVPIVSKILGDDLNVSNTQNFILILLLES